VLSIIGIIISLFYFWEVAEFSLGDQDYDEELENTLANWITSEKKNEGLPMCEKLKVVLKDYEISNATVHRRDNIDLLIGSILITGSLLVLANTSVSETLAHPMGIYALASIALYSIWLLVLNSTSRKLNRLAYSRIKAIERALTKLGYEFGIHSYNIQKTRTTSERPIRWIRLRKTFWGLILLLLSIAWMSLSLT